MAHVYDFYKPNLASEYPVSISDLFVSLCFRYRSHIFQMWILVVISLFNIYLLNVVSVQYGHKLSYAYLNWGSVRLAFSLLHPLSGDQIAVFSIRLLLSFYNSSVNKRFFRLSMESFLKHATLWPLIHATNNSARSKFL